jgi:hypothetical protein
MRMHSHERRDKYQTIDRAQDIHIRTSCNTFRTALNMRLSHLHMRCCFSIAACFCRNNSPLFARRTLYSGQNPSPRLTATYLLSRRLTSDFNLRKQQTLYTVIQQEESKVGSGDLVGSSFRYNIPDPTAAAAMAAKKDKNHVNIIRNQATSGVEVTIDASELENMDESLLAEK